MDNAARMRQRLLAVFLPLAAVLYVSAEALRPQRHRPNSFDDGRRAEGAAYRG